MNSQSITSQSVEIVEEITRIFIQAGIHLDAVNNYCVTAANSCACKTTNTQSEFIHPSNNLPSLPTQSPALRYLRLSAGMNHANKLWLAWPHGALPNFVSPTKVWFPNTSRHLFSYTNPISSKRSCSPIPPSTLPFFLNHCSAI